MASPKIYIFKDIFSERCITYVGVPSCKLDYTQNTAVKRGYTETCSDLYDALEHDLDLCVLSCRYESETRNFGEQSRRFVV